MVALACRRWPALRVVPRRWIRPVLVPAAVRLRRGISVAALVVAATAGVIIALLALWPGCTGRRLRRKLLSQSFEDASGHAREPSSRAHGRPRIATAASRFTGAAHR